MVNNKSGAVLRENANQSCIVTTLIVKPWVVENDRAILRQYLESRGSEIKRFDFVRWVNNWLKDPAGSFWGRRVVVPKVGDVCVAKVEPCVRKGDGYVAKGRISDTACIVHGAEEFSEEIKVRVVSIGEKEAECEVVDDKVPLTRVNDVEYKIYYSATGVTGLLERVPWRDGVAVLSHLQPNEKLPVGILAGFERIRLPPSINRDFYACVEAVPNDDAGYSLVVECDNCNGDGELTCRKCGGAGRYQPTCNACGGAGSSTCRRCSGSGQWKYGGQCNACGGSGKHECGVCHGEGHLDFVCKACGGKGEQECWVCRGSGIRRVRIDNKTGVLTISGKDKARVQVDPEAVFLWRERDGHRMELSGSWNEIEQYVKQVLDRRGRSAARVLKLKRKFEEILKGLDEKILHNDPAKLPRIRAVLGMAALERKRGNAVYLLKEKGESTWKNDDDEPYPKGMRLKIEGVELPQDSPISYEGYRPSSRELVVSFPQQVDVSGLRGRELEIRSAEMRPPEIRQREYLQRWMATGGSAIYRAMVDGCKATRAKGVKLFNKRIAEFARQREAVEWGLSDAPMFLLKGPPGTGKTTIIVEIIRQAIHRGQRVLLTSQTHQAVENVLERLHAIVESGDDKTVRMVHYTAQEGKSSELARHYSDGTGTAEIKAIRESVAEVLAKNGRQIAWMSNPSVISSLRKLCDEGASCAQRILDAQGARRMDLETLDRELAESVARVNAETDSLLEALECGLGAEVSRGQQEIAEKNLALESAQKAVARTAAQIFEKEKRIESLTTGLFGGRVLRALSVFNKNFDVDVVSGDLECAREEKSRAVARQEGLSVDIRGIESFVEKKQTAYEKEKSAIRRRADSKKVVNSAEVERRRARKITEHSQTLDKIHELYRQQIANINQFLGEDAGLKEDSGALDWQGVYQGFERERNRLECVQAFVTGWEKTLADKSEAVGRFLNSQTNVFLATCVGVGGWRSLMDGTYDRRFEDVDGVKSEKFFDLVIVDEAGQATCAETIIPLSMGKRAILIGDDKQLPPMSDKDLETESLFSYLWEDRECDVPRVMLDTQFRMHPDIAGFVSDTFYNGELKNGVTEADRVFQFSDFNKPVCLLSTSNQSNHYETFKRIGKKTNYRNQLEALYVKEIVDALIRHCNEYGVKGEHVSVAVITPYAWQVSLIRQMLKPVIGSSGNVQISEDDIASVDKFQGGERDVVIASFVRSPNPKGYAPKLTFVQDLKRMNVAFSRPRKMLILVGDITALSTGLGDEDGRKAFAAFHHVVQKRGREILAWERGA